MDGWQRLNAVIGLHVILIPFDTKKGGNVSLFYFMANPDCQLEKDICSYSLFLPS